MRLHSSIYAALFCVLAGGPLAAQGTSTPDTANAATRAYHAEGRIETALRHLGERGADSTHKLVALGAREAAESYRDLAASPSHTAELLSQVLEAFYVGTAGARGAAQVSEVADEQGLRLSLLRAAQGARRIEQQDKLIAQNERIIQLLEQIAKKK